ncbi:predicted protein [Plenodomus lingam JN3]|uniref:Predicted protein n=1 Tax=Leptosphaeria maculans (strain JN3 / isolate v23.1.3 / race Av1-4-5-6-7-8) TaxID=985895 RepID=E4ZSE8_LEPMJ|nr:predicted protein [Plenodomus lingam JN3]CBX94328.1 predicted protein [Plenodomus lingam JN3]
MKLTISTCLLFVAPIACKWNVGCDCASDNMDAATLRVEQCCPTKRYGGKVTQGDKRLGNYRYCSWDVATEQESVNLLNSIQSDWDTCSLLVFA